MWNSLGIKLKVKMLKDRYSDILEVALFKAEGLRPSNYMSGGGTSVVQPSASESGSGVSLVSTDLMSSSSNSSSEQASGGGNSPC